MTFTTKDSENHLFINQIILFYMYTYHTQSIAPIVISLCIILYVLGEIPFNEVKAQDMSYLRVNTTNILAHNSTASSILCNKDDGLASGGYQIGFTSNPSGSNTTLYSNHPIYKKNNTGAYEGWESGIINNNANKNLTITTFGLCLNLTASP